MDCAGVDLTGPARTSCRPSASSNNARPDTPTPGDRLVHRAFDVQSGQAMGLGGSGARATYAAGGRRVDFRITDMGGMGAFAAVAGFAQVTGESESDTKVEKTYKQGARTVHEEASKDGSRAEVTVFLGNGVVVEASGRHMDVAALHKALDEAGLAKIESIKRADKS